MVKYKEYKSNYIVLDNGDVYRKWKNHYSKQAVSKNEYGYYRVSINCKPELAHRVVMSAFKGDSDLTVDHLNGIKTDNRLENLEYVTQKENVLRMFERVGTTGAENGKKHAKKVIWNNTEFESVKALARFLGYASNGYLNYCLKNNKKIKGHLAKRSELRFIKFNGHQT